MPPGRFKKEAEYTEIKIVVHFNKHFRNTVNTHL